MTHDAKEVLKEAQTVHEQLNDTLRPIADWFHEHEGELFERAEAKTRLDNTFGVGESLADEAIAQLVSDMVDPVVQIPCGSERFVGVVEYEEFDGAYGYVDYHDVQGQRKRVVCQQCVNEATHDKEVAHATANARVNGEIQNIDASYEDLVDKVHEHYEVHNEKPGEVETGASLVTGTTIGGNIAYHTGNFTPTWVDSGTDNSDGGNIYELPQTSDGINVRSANINNATISGADINVGFSWTGIASMSGARNVTAAVYDGNNIYAIGGDNGNSNYLSSVERYDPSSNSWTNVSSLNYARQQHAAAYGGDNIYAIGGYSSNSVFDSSVEEYDPSSDSWTIVSSMPTARYKHDATFDGTYIYAIGGEKSNSNYLSSVGRYDPSSNSWTTVSSMPTARSGLGVTFDGTDIYAIGGDGGNGYVTTVEKYDPSNDSWTTVSSIGSPRAGLGATYDGTYVYAIGGYANGYSRRVERYDPSTDSWEKISGLGTRREGVGTAAIGNDVYAIGGYDGSEQSSAEKGGKKDSLTL